MTTHTTATGMIELVDSWGHGKVASGDWHKSPATIIVDDGDGHYDAWRFTGARKDAVAKAASFVSTRDGQYVIVDDGDEVFALQTPDDLFPAIEWEDGEPVDWAKEPDPAVIARLNIVHY